MNGIFFPKRGIRITLAAFIWLIPCMNLAGLVPAWAASENTVKPITWGKAYQDGEQTVIPASLQADFGTFNFQCLINPAGQASFITLQPRGGGELPPMKVQLYLVMNGDRSVTLCKRWFPLLGSKDPETLKVIVRVDEKELFQTAPRPEPSQTAVGVGKAQMVKWGKPQKGEALQYLPGTVRAGNGYLKLFWKTLKDRAPELVVKEAGCDGKNSQDVKLFIFHRSQGITTLYREFPLSADKKGTACLQVVATVKTASLTKGMKRSLRF